MTFLRKLHLGYCARKEKEGVLPFCLDINRGALFT